MKKFIITSLFILLTGGLFVSCASAPKSEAEDNKTKEPLPLFDDWQYKGFGQELPLWVKPALNQNEKKVKDCFPEEASESIIIITTQGTNSDQALNKIEEEASLTVTPEYELLAGTWVRYNLEALNKKNIAAAENPYVAIRIYKLK